MLSLYIVFHPWRLSDLKHTPFNPRCLSSSSRFSIRKSFHSKLFFFRYPFQTKISSDPRSFSNSERKPLIQVIFHVRCLQSRVSSVQGVFSPRCLQSKASSVEVAFSPRCLQSKVSLNSRRLSVQRVEQYKASCNPRRLSTQGVFQPKASFNAKHLSVQSVFHSKASFDSRCFQSKVSFNN